MKGLKRGRDKLEIDPGKTVSIDFEEKTEMLLEFQGKELKIVHAPDEIPSDYLFIDPEIYDLERRKGYKPFSDGSKFIVGHKISDLPFKLDVEEKEPIYFSLSASNGIITIKNYSEHKLLIELMPQQNTP
ncbi:MAG: hypothetical protein ACP5GB_03135 [Candidatus Micrarchaeia archaeon]